MINKIICYVLVIPFVTWILDSININNLFKKNKVIQARMLYILLIIVLSYLVVSFLFDVAITKVN